MNSASDWRRRTRANDNASRNRINNDTDRLEIFLRRSFAPSRRVLFLLHGTSVCDVLMSNHLHQHGFSFSLARSLFHSMPDSPCRFPLSANTHHPTRTYHSASIDLLLTHLTARARANTADADLELVCCARAKFPSHVGAGWKSATRLPQFYVGQL
jgi:hypothetical protein